MMANCWSLLFLTASVSVLAQTHDVPVSFMTYNVQSFPDFIQRLVYPPNLPRIKSIPKQTMKAAEDQLHALPDFICFQEAFSAGVQKEIALFAEEQGYSVLGPIKGTYRPFQPLNGGAVILSKTDITYFDSRAFPIRTTCGLDKLARKGFIYMETTINGALIGIVATHLQAADSMCAKKGETAEEVAAGKQIQQLEFIHQYLEEAKRQTAAVFLVGDLNLNSFDTDQNAINFNKIKDALHTIGAEEPKLDIDTSSKLRASFDPKTNNYLAKVDPKTVPEHDDYVLVLSRGSAKVEMTNKIVPVKDGDEDLSDHHAVLGRALIKYN